MSDAKAKLIQLKELLDMGVISQADFDSQKQELFSTEYEESMLSAIAKKPLDGVLLTFQESAHEGVLSENLPDLESHRVLCRQIAVRVNAICLPSVAVPHED